MPIWNPWHGCHKISPGCLNCYVYRRDESIGKDASVVKKTGDFDLPLKRDRQGRWKLNESPVYTCMTSDFFLDEADPWRQDCWDMIRRRGDLDFVIITKRIHRFMDCVPPDWGDGWPNVTIICTCENQERTDYRMPIFLSLPIRHKAVIHEPMLGPINIEPYLNGIESVTCGGESGDNARPCRYEWILATREQCVRHGVPFHFKQAGAVFIKDGRCYRVDRRFQQTQARKARIDYSGPAGTAWEGPNDS